MGKILIITRHAVPNYGSILQAIATVEYFRSKGIESEILDYVPIDEKPENLYIPMLANSRFSRNRVLKSIYALVRCPDFRIMGERFRKFEKELLPLTQEYNNLDNSVLLPRYDAYVTGSDQVWGQIALQPYDKHYFWDFIESDNIFAFSSSFGKTQYGEEDIETFKSLLSKYKAITVREQSAINLLKRMNIVDAWQTLDPTLLVGKDYWNMFASTRPINQKYVMVYQIHDNKKMDDYARQIEKKLQIPLIRVSNSFSHVVRSGKLQYLPTPQDFLGLIRNAEYILTDSFHATVFSIVFEKNFSIVNSGVTNTRIESLLRTFALEDRSIDGFNDFSQTTKKIDYNKVNSILEVERAKSSEVIENTIISKIRRE